MVSETERHGDGVSAPGSSGWLPWVLVGLLLTPLVAGLYFRFPSAVAALTTMTVSVIGEVIIHFATGGKGWWIFNPIALGIFVGIATMAVMGVIAPNRTPAAPLSVGQND